MAYTLSSYMEEFERARQHMYNNWLTDSPQEAYTTTSLPVDRQIMHNFWSDMLYDLRPKESKKNRVRRQREEREKIELDKKIKYLKVLLENKKRWNCNKIQEEEKCFSTYQQLDTFELINWNTSTTTPLVWQTDPRTNGWVIQTLSEFN